MGASYVGAGWGVLQALYGLHLDSMHLRTLTCILGVQALNEWESPSA